ncbi:XrtA/PEP-CTERM system amidotransferase [Kordiimonas aquimaris]|uniref:XrtA/PEP-CTERM system amidotransferase n=1 Tax=Kordiimonas aquimaris TaxID=707591 RepID=UPI0021CF0994|nr:XrtA/PEP-CTERM system amidotransferase [Kordiimonas aquimaris]
MCGITGWMTHDGSLIEERLLKHMTNQIAHRGPDGDGYFNGGDVGLGHRRLSIIDLDGGKQPMYCDQKEVVLSYNGEIYNYQTLRQELEGLGHQFKTSSDTEVVLCSYKQWGEACVERFRGMFAFAIWDGGKQSLLLARDRVGIKPLHYSFLPSGDFIFASELKAILAHDNVPRVLRLDALEDYLTLGYVPDPKTILEHVHKLPPASTMVLVKGSKQPQIRTYWTPGFNEHVQALSVQEDLLPHLEEAVRMRMIADVPLGAFLSGGVDSSAVVGLMAKNSTKKVETCAIGFDDPDYDESGHAQVVADHFNTSHRFRLVSATDSELIDKMADVFDEPFADASALPTYRVCALAREKVTVALSGDGGDELFAGYRRHKFHMAEETMRSKLPLAIRQPVFGTLGSLYPKLDWAPQFLRAKTTFEALSRTSAQAYCHSVSRTSDRERTKLHSSRMTKLLNGYHPHERFEELADEVKGQDALTTIQYIDFKTYLPGDILTKVDRTSMANSLEVRVPILDHKFVEWGFRVPPKNRIVEGSGKAIFKGALRGFLPEHIIDRKKRGFVAPTVNWMRDELSNDVRALAKSKIFTDSGLFNVKTIKRLAEEHISGVRDHHTTLWSLIMLERSLTKLNVQIPTA